MTFPRRPHRPARIIKPARTGGGKSGCGKAAMFVVGVPFALALIITYAALADHTTGMPFALALILTYAALADHAT